MSLISGCRKTLTDDTVEALPVFASFLQPWAKDPRGAEPPADCEQPFGFDLGLDRQVPDAVFLSVVEEAFRQQNLSGAQEPGGFTRLDTPLMSTETLDAMRVAEQTQWKVFLGQTGGEHEPRTPFADKDMIYSPGTVCLLPALAGFDHGARLAVGSKPCAELSGTDYYWKDRQGRIVGRDVQSNFDGTLLVARTSKLLLLAKRCDMSGCILVDWVELSGTPFVEHMKIDEGGGAGERRYVASGVSRIEQRKYRRHPTGLACLEDSVVRDMSGGFLKPWADGGNQTETRYAADVFGQGFLVGEAATLDTVDSGATSAEPWTAGDGSLGGTIAAGFYGVVSVGLALKDADLPNATVFIGGVKTDSRASRGD